MNTCTMKDVYDKFGLEATTRDFIGHSMALYQTDEYIDIKGMAQDTISRIRLYANSMARYGKSPYIYPLYGLGELPQGFARLSAIYGGTYMLNAKISGIEYHGDGKIRGVSTGEGLMRCKKIVASPNYFPELVKQTSRFVISIC